MLIIPENLNKNKICGGAGGGYIFFYINPYPANVENMVSS